MSSQKIGIKIANRTFYPIMDEESPGRKRLTLTTVRDDQDNVQIDLYRGEGDSLENAQYIGSLVIEDIQTAASGEPEISLNLELDEDGIVRATAADSATGVHQSLSVSLESVQQDELAMPDFELDEPSFDDLELEEEKPATEEPEEEVEEFSLDDLDLELEEEETIPDLAETEEAETEETETEKADRASPQGEPEPDELSLDNLSLELEEQTGASETEDLLMEDFDFDESAESEEIDETEADEAAENAEDILADELSDELELEEADSTAGTVSVSEADEESEAFEDADELSLDDFDFGDIESEEMEAGGEQAEEQEPEVSFGDEDFNLDELGDEAAEFGDEGLGDDDFSFEEPEPTADSSFEAGSELEPAPASEETQTDLLPPRRGNNVVMIGFVILALAALAVLAYFIFQLLSGDPAPPLEAGASFAVAVAPVPLRRRLFRSR